MRILLISTAVIGLATTVPVLAQAAPMASQPRQQQPAAGQNSRDEAGERQVCMNVQLSNSRIARRVCRTEREWARSGELERDD
jgi:hypothetical protein